MIGGASLASNRVSWNGPDWTDVALAVTAVEEFHRVDVTLLFRLPRPGRKGLLELLVKAEKRLNENTGRPASVSRSVMISGGSPLTVAATTYRLVLELDHDCGTMWMQSELFPSV